jgi:hypothetical protein
MAPEIYRNRLASKTDKWLFLVVWLLGTGGILTFKVVGVRQAASVLWGISSLLVYGFVVWRSPHFRAREDHAGDGAYYLGFLFTLSSLAFALWEFGNGAGDTQAIIGNFAVALVTTIVGLVLRVLFQQLREDPSEVELEVRLGLQDAAARVKGILLQTLEDFSTIRTVIAEEMQAKIPAMLEETLRSFKESQLEAFTAFNARLAESADRFAEAAKASEHQLNLAREGVDKLGASIEQLNERIERAEVPTDSFKRKLSELTTTVENTLGSAEACSGKTAKVCDEVDALVARALATAKGLEATCATLDGSVVKVDRLLLQLAASADNVRSKTEEAIAASLSVANMHSHTMAAMVEGAEKSFETIRRHEEQIGQAVALSGRAVAKTHDSLASLADTIVERLSVR